MGDKNTKMADEEENGDLSETDPEDQEDEDYVPEGRQLDLL